MGTKADNSSRLQKTRKYLQSLVTRARMGIYHAGNSITGVAVEGLLKATSSVPVMVRGYSTCLITVRDNTGNDRMRLRSASVKDLMFHECWPLT